MKGIVNELQSEVLQSNCDVVSVLRKAHLIAVKLNLTEFDTWIINELNGYSDSEMVPSYRRIRGSLKYFNPYRGWMNATIINEKVEKEYCTRPVLDSISQIVSLCNSGNKELMDELSGAQQAYLNRVFKAPTQVQFALHFSVSSVKNVIEMVKNTILEWTIKMDDEGIIGEGMEFNLEEKELAKRIPQTIHNYYGNTNVINAPVDGSVISVGDDSRIEFTYESVKSLSSEIRRSIDNEALSDDDKDTVLELLAEIDDKVENKKRPGVIKSLLAGLKEFLISVGASATVALIQAKLQGWI